MPDPAARKRTVAFALFASSAIVVLVALLVFVNVIDVGEEIRPILVGVLALTAVVDVFMGWRFLSASASE